MILSLLACNPCSEGPPRVELGVGVDDYLAVEDLHPAPLVYGFQGGQHIDLAVQGTGLQHRGTASAELVGMLDGEIVGSGEPWFDLECRDGVISRAGLRLFVFETSWLDVVDRAVDIQAKVIDAHGREAYAERTLVIVSDPWGTP